MTTMNIAIIGGVVLLLILLVKVRRDRAKDAPAAAKGRAKGDKREKRGKRRKDAPPAPPEPMPLAAAASETAVTTAAVDEPMGPPAPEWPEDEAWPQEDDPFARLADELQQEPFAETPDERAEDEPAVAEQPGAAPAGWSDDELVTAPGWPMPGEVDMAWSSSSLPAEAPVAEPAFDAATMYEEPSDAAGFDPATGWAEEAPAADVQEFEWAAPEAEPVQEIPAWDEPAQDEAAYPEWTPEPAGDAQDTGELAIEPAGEPEPEIGFEPEAEIAFEPQPEIDFAPEPEIDFAPEPEIDFAPGPEITFEPEAAVEPEADPVALWDALTPVAEAPAAPAPADATPWWDEEPEVPAVAPQDEAARSGRFALGGFALQPGQQALGGVTFREELQEPPARWSVAPADEAAPGTLVLSLDGAINCDADGLEVVTEAGFAPTSQGFTVRVAAKGSGPFAASGTFRVS